MSESKEHCVKIIFNPALRDQPTDVHLCELHCYLSIEHNTSRILAMHVIWFNMIPFQSKDKWFKMDPEDGFGWVIRAMLISGQSQMKGNSNTPFLNFVEMWDKNNCYVSVITSKSRFWT